MKHLKESFEELANEENQELYYNGEEEFQDYYELRPNYKDQEIIITNLLGDQSYGRIMLRTDDFINPHEFKIETIDPLISLLTFRKYRIKIKSDSALLNKCLADSVALSELHEIVKHTQFNPTIFGEIRDDHFEIRTEYHLLLKNKGEVLKPLLNFYKELIDYFM